MSLFLDVLFSFLGPRTLAAFQHECGRPTETQEQLLRRIIEKNQETAYGALHRFSKIMSFGHFKRRVPISTYEDLRPYIDASLRGEPNQLTAERPVLFAATSGTTGASKYIPVTPESRPLKSYLMRVWLSALQRDHRVFGGRVLTIVSPEVESYAPCGEHPVGLNPVTDTRTSRRPSSPSIRVLMKFTKSKIMRRNTIVCCA